MRVRRETKKRAKKVQLAIKRMSECQNVRKEWCMPHTEKRVSEFEDFADEVEEETVVLARFLQVAGEKGVLREEEGGEEKTDDGEKNFHRGLLIWYEEGGLEHVHGILKNGVVDFTPP